MKDKRIVAVAYYFLLSTLILPSLFTLIPSLMSFAAMVNGEGANQGNMLQHIVFVLFMILAGTFTVSFFVSAVGYFMMKKGTFWSKQCFLLPLYHIGLFVIVLLKLFVLEMIF